MLRFPLQAHEIFINILFKVAMLVDDLLGVGKVGVACMYSVYCFEFNPVLCVTLIFIKC